MCATTPQQALFLGLPVYMAQLLRCLFVCLLMFFSSVLGMEHKRSIKQFLTSTAQFHTTNVMLLNIDGERCKIAHCYIIFPSNSSVDYTSTLVWKHMPVIPALARRGPENHKFKVILSRLSSVRSAWVGYTRFRL